MDAIMATNLDLVDVSRPEAMDDASKLMPIQKLQRIKLFEGESSTKHKCLQFTIDILEKIAEHIESISDFIRFRSVCRLWREAAPPRKLRPQPPILLLPYDVYKPDRYFFSFATRQIHHISLPQLVCKQIQDSANGWMFLFDILTEELSLYNPVTLANILFPPSENISEYGVDVFCLYYDPYSDDFAVIHSIEGKRKHWFCKVRDESWTELKIDLKYYSDPITYYKGKFFAKVTPLIYVIDASSGQSLLAVSIMDMPTTYGSFVTANGELFLAFECTKDGISLRKLDYNGQQITLSKVQFEDYAIFASFIQQQSMFCVKDFPQYKKKCTYLTTCWDNDVDICIRVRNHEDGTDDYIQCGWETPGGFEEEHLWITLSLQ